MTSLVRSALQWLAETRLARGVVDTLLRSRARRRVAELDQQAVGRCQNRTLLGLVHKAHATRFGRDHEFGRIRTAGDFQRLVPLRTPAELWREYWQPAYPNLAGATWPGPIPYLAISSVQQNGPFPYIPVSPALWAAQQTAALTALAFAMHARPQARLCTGRLFLLGDGSSLTRLQGPAVSHQQSAISSRQSSQIQSLEAIAVRELPVALRPYAFSSSRWHGGNGSCDDERVILDLAERTASMPVTCVAGTADRLTRFFGHVKRVTGRERLADIWPGLAAVLYARGAVDVDRAQLASEVGSTAVCVLELYFCPEGAVAVEDPRHGRLRLLPDHGVYFEFVPVDQIGKPRPARYSAADVKPGVPYALALSSPAGIWACLVGSVVCFERLDPPLLRLVEAPVWQAVQIAPQRGLAPAVPSPTAVGAGPRPAPSTPLHPFPAQPPHSKTGEDTPWLVTAYPLERKKE